MRKDQPVLSVVILVGEQRDRSARGLRSILEQSIIDQMEILLVDCSSPGTPPLPASDHPSVRVIRLSTDVLEGAARAESVRQAHSPVVAFFQEHNIALPGWAEALVRVHQGPWVGVCGEVLNGNPGIGVSDALVLINHATETPPAKRKESELLPSYNSAYKREILLQYDHMLDTLMRCETVLQWKLGQDGYKLLIDPDVRLVHYYVTDLMPYLKGHYAWNRSCAHTRAEVFKWTLWRRTLYACAMMLSPWLRLARLLVFVIRQHPQQIGAYFRNLPVMWLVQTYFAIGRAVGVLVGMGNSETRILPFELNADRPAGD